MRFHRSQLAESSYSCNEGDHRYVIEKNEHGQWMLTVKALTETCGVIHTLGQPVIAASVHPAKFLAVATARQYVWLGEEYKAHEHGYCERMTESINLAYAEARK